ncbi:MAG: extracellular solute-binding protein [Proteobacteria bacterium]|nr:extracellular solute-binding protein [Pseudomonadota bacterium]
MQPNRRAFMLTGLAAATATTLARPAIAKPVTLTYWTPLDPKSKNPRSRGEAAMIAVFRKRHPDIEVSIQPVPWQVIGQQMMQAVLGGGGPDVAQLSTTNLPDQVAADTVKPLDDYVGKHWTTEEKQDFLLPWSNTVYDSKKMGFYWNTILNNQLWYLRDEVSGTPPMKWDAFAEFMVPQAKKANKPGFLTGLSQTGNAVQFTSWLIPAFWASGADYLTPDGKPGFLNAGGEKPFAWLMALIDKYKITPSSITSLTRDNVLDGLEGRRALSTMMGSNVVSTARRSLGNSLVLADQPGPNGPCPAFGTGKFLVMNKQTQHAEAAGLFIEAMISPDAQLANAKISGEIPAVKSVLKDPWFKTPQAADIRSYLEYLAAYPHPFKYQKGNQFLATRMALAAQQMVEGKPIRAALKEVAAQWEQQQQG